MTPILISYAIIAQIQPLLTTLSAKLISQCLSSSFFFIPPILLTTNHTLATILAPTIFLALPVCATKLPFHSLSPLPTPSNTACFRSTCPAPIPGSCSLLCYLCYPSTKQASKVWRECVIPCSMQADPSTNALNLHAYVRAPRNSARSLRKNTVPSWSVPVPD